MRVFFSSRERTWGVLDGLGVAGLVGLLVARFIPVARLLPFWGCPLRQATGWPCLGCGLTRAADHFSHGHFLRAWEANPLGTVAAALFAGAALWTGARWLLRLPQVEVRLSEKEAWMARGAVAMLVGVNYVWVVVKTRFPQVLF